jgi:hypothetical protein
MNNNLEQLLTDFNTLLLDLIQNIADVCPDSIVCIHKKTIERELKRYENRTKFIDGFVGRVLQYKSKIDEGDETFFMHKSYDDDVTPDLSHQVFEFKSIWSKLKKENKEFVIQYMQLLCELAQKYFVALYP